VQQSLTALGKLQDSPINLAIIHRFSVELFARQGRVVVAGSLQQGRAKGAPGLFEAARREARSEWLFPGAVGSDQLRTSVMITNPGSQPLSVEASAASKSGLVHPAGFDDVIQAGGFRQIDVPLSSSGPYALRLRSRNNAPFYAGALVTQPNSAESYLDPGCDPQGRWILPQAPQSQGLVLANLSGAPVTSTLRPLGPAAATALTPVSLQPGFLRQVALPRTGGAVLVEASGQGVLAFAPGESAISASQVGGVPPGGPIVPGPAAAP
jgi:hypothetical protein